MRRLKSAPFVNAPGIAAEELLDAFVREGRRLGLIAERPRLAGGATGLETRHVPAY